MIDLRSDTVTKPSEEMRAAMAAAEVGDDVFGDDPTVNKLQELAAVIFEKEAALWVPTGCMGNEIAVKVHTRPGDEIITEERGHILNFEVGAAAVISGVTIRPVKSADGSGHLTWDEIKPALKLDVPYYQSKTRLICLENTHNFAGGSVMTAAQCFNVCGEAHAVGLPVHMDGARIYNAAVALNTSVAELTKECDSVMVTLSKGLGAPAGSLPHGDERRLGVARALATEPRFLLMDEPAAGLPEAEVPAFADVVRSVRDDHDVGVLLIDHNMALIMGVCDRIQVLDQGRTLAEGSPTEIRGNLDVAAAYLGESAVRE